MNSATHQEMLRKEFENNSEFVFQCAKCSKYYKHVSWKLNYGVCTPCKKDLKYNPVYTKKNENDMVLENPFEKKKKEIKIFHDYL